MVRGIPRRCSGTLGKDDESLRWLENGFGGTADATTFRAQVLLAYARFVRRWSACDARRS